VWQGEVVGIYLAPGAAQRMQGVAEVRAVTGKGLEGDRYFRGVGTYSDKPGPHREITLIATEALDAVRRETGINLAPGESRRNIAGSPSTTWSGRSSFWARSGCAPFASALPASTWRSSPDCPASCRRWWTGVASGSRS